MAQMMNDMMQGPGMGQGAPAPQPGQQGPAAAGPAAGGGQQDPALLQAIDEMGDLLIQQVGLEGYAGILQDALQQLQSQGQQPAEPQLPSSAPVPGGEAFGKSYE